MRRHLVACFNTAAMMLPAVLLFTLFLVGGCAQPEAKTGSRLSPRDSAGVEIVESSDAQWPYGRAWIVEDSVLLDLATSGSGAAHEFYRVRDALRLRDGRVVVADEGSGEVRFFSAAGELIAVRGRKGQGPGEFRSLSTLSRWKGDSVAVFDARLRRATVLSESGGVRTVPVQAPAFDVLHLRASPDWGFVGFFSPVDEARQGPSPEPEAYRVTFCVLHLDSEGAVTDTLGSVRGYEGYRTPSLNGHLVISKDAHLSLFGPDLVLGSADLMEFDRYKPMVGQYQRARVPNFHLALSESLIEGVRDLLLEAVKSEPPFIREAFEKMPLPASRPAYSDLLVDERGFVWAAPYHVPGEPVIPRSWQVFDSSGAWLGSVEFPDSFAVLEIGSDYVLGVFRGELGVEHVQVRRLTRDLEIDPRAR